MNIKQITKEEASEMMYDHLAHEYIDRGLYIVEETENETFVGIDNSSGHMWVEAWPTREECESWLKGEIDAKTNDAS